MEEGRWGFVDRAGRFAIAAQSGGALDFSEGIAAVLPEGGWGFIDRTGRLVVPHRYYEARSFSEGRAAFRQRDAS